MTSRTPFLAAFVRGTAFTLGLVAFAATVLVGRYLLFEYRYGDPQVVQAMLDKVLP